MDAKVFNIQHIQFNTTATTQDEAFQAIAKIAYDAGFVESETRYYEGLWEREKEATTGFQDGIAIPHSKSTTCLKPGVFLIKFAKAMEWNALDEQPVNVALALTIPEDGGTQHLRILSKLARKMIDEEFRQAVKNSSDKQTLYEVISAIEI